VDSSGTDCRDRLARVPGDEYSTTERFDMYRNVVDERGNGEPVTRQSD
jgi:hypothetical protein